MPAMLLTDKINNDLVMTSPREPNEEPLNEDDHDSDDSRFNHLKILFSEYFDTVKEFLTQTPEGIECLSLICEDMPMTAIDSENLNQGNTPCVPDQIQKILDIQSQYPDSEIKVIITPKPLELHLTE